MIFWLFKKVDKLISQVFFGTKTPQPTKKNAESTPYDPTIQLPHQNNSTPTQLLNNPAGKRFLISYDPARRYARSD